MTVLDMFAGAPWKSRPVKERSQVNPTVTMATLMMSTTQTTTTTSSTAMLTAPSKVTETVQVNFDGIKSKYNRLGILDTSPTKSPDKCHSSSTDVRADFSTSHLRRSQHRHSSKRSHHPSHQQPRRDEGRGKDAHQQPGKDEARGNDAHQQPGKDEARGNDAHQQPGRDEGRGKDAHQQPGRDEARGKDAHQQPGRDQARGKDAYIKSSSTTDVSKATLVKINIGPDDKVLQSDRSALLNETRKSQESSKKIKPLLEDASSPHYNRGNTNSGLISQSDKSVSQHASHHNDAAKSEKYPSLHSSQSETDISQHISRWYKSYLNAEKNFSSSAGSHVKGGLSNRGHDADGREIPGKGDESGTTCRTVKHEEQGGRRGSREQNQGVLNMLHGYSLSPPRPPSQDEDVSRFLGHKDTLSESIAAGCQGDSVTKSQHHGRKTATDRLNSASTAVSSHLNHTGLHRISSQQTNSVTSASSHASSTVSTATCLRDNSIVTTSSSHNRCGPVMDLRPGYDSDSTSTSGSVSTRHHSPSTLHPQSHSMGQKHHKSKHSSIVRHKTPQCSQLSHVSTRDHLNTKDHIITMDHLKARDHLNTMDHLKTRDHLKTSHHHLPHSTTHSAPTHDKPSTCHRVNTYQSASQSNINPKCIPKESNMFSGTTDSPSNIDQTKCSLITHNKTGVEDLFWPGSEPSPAGKYTGALSTKGSSKNSRSVMCVDMKETSGYSIKEEELEDKPGDLETHTKYSGISYHACAVDRGIIESVRVSHEVLCHDGLSQQDVKILGLNDTSQLSAGVNVSLSECMSGDSREDKLRMDCSLELHHSAAVLSGNSEASVGSLGVELATEQCATSLDLTPSDSDVENCLKKRSLLQESEISNSHCQDSVVRYDDSKDSLTSEAQPRDCMSGESDSQDTSQDNPVVKSARESSSSASAMHSKPPSGRTHTLQGCKPNSSSYMKSSEADDVPSSTSPHPLSTSSNSSTSLSLVGFLSPRPSEKLLASLKKDRLPSPDLSDNVSKDIISDSESNQQSAQDFILANLQTNRTRKQGKRCTSDLGFTSVPRMRSDISPRTSNLLQNPKLRQHLASALQLDPKHPDFVGSVHGKLRHPSAPGESDTDRHVTVAKSMTSLSPSNSFVSRRRPSDSFLDTSVSLDFQTKARETASKFHVPSFKEYRQSRRKHLNGGNRLCSSYEFINEVVEDDGEPNTKLNSSTTLQDKYISPSEVGASYNINSHASRTTSSLSLKPPKPDKSHKKLLYKALSHSELKSDALLQSERDEKSKANKIKLNDEEDVSGCHGNGIISDWPEEDDNVFTEAYIATTSTTVPDTEEEMSESTVFMVTTADLDPQQYLDAPPGFRSAADTSETTNHQIKRKKSSLKKSSRRNTSVPLKDQVAPSFGWDEKTLGTDEESVTTKQSRKLRLRSGKNSSKRKSKSENKLGRKQSESGSKENESSPSHYSQTEVACQDCHATLLAPPGDHLVTRVITHCTRCHQRRRDRREAINELVATELSYGKDLALIKNEFEQPLLTTAMISREQGDTLFGNLDELIAINQQFVRQIQSSLEQAVASDDKDFLNVSMGRPFLEASTMLLAFETYCCSQSTAPALLDSLISEKRLLKLFLEVASKENPALRRMDLKSFLMVPVQRVMKYPLLLGRITKATPHKHEDYSLLKKAKSRVEEILEHINSQSKGSTSHRKRHMSWVTIAKRAATAENIELSRLALELLGWSRHEAYFIHTGHLFYSLPNDSSWPQRQTSLKFQATNAVLVSLGRNPSLDQEAKKRLLFPRSSCVQDVALVLFREKAGRFQPLRDPLHLSQCVISMETTSSQLFEIQEMLKDPYLVKGEDADDTLLWYEKLCLHGKDQGRWRRRRPAMSNIMMLTTATSNPDS